MSRALTVLLCTVVTILFLVTGLASAQEWSIQRLTTNANKDNNPQINNNGQVVWHGCEDYSDGDPTIPFCDTGDSQIFYYDGSNTIQLMGGIRDNYLTRQGLPNWFGDGSSKNLNDNGLVTWVGWDGNDYEIFLFNGSETIQITDNNIDDLVPVINENNWVAWVVDSPDIGNLEIMVYDGNTIHRITNDTDMDHHPCLNDSGALTWIREEEGGDGEEIFMTDCPTCPHENVSNAPGDDFRPMINSAGEITWIRFQLVLYRGLDGTTQEIFSNLHNYSDPRINAEGNVVWGQLDPPIYDGGPIYLFEGASTSIISPTECDTDHCDHREPWINVNGHVVWNTSYRSYSPFLFEYGLWFFDGINARSIFHQDHTDPESENYYHPMINDFDEIVWVGCPNGEDCEIYLARPCHDMDEDGFLAAACGGDDCDDADPDVNPSVTEGIAYGNCHDGIDNDCDGIIDVGLKCTLWDWVKPMTTEPVLDGDISPGEWIDAFSVEISETKVPVTLYLKVDGDSLYVAIDDHNEFWGGSSAQIWFDEDNDDAWPGEDGAEGALTLEYSDLKSLETYFNGYYMDGDNVQVGGMVTPAPGVTGMVSTYAGGPIQQEWRIDFAESPMNVDFYGNVGLYVRTTVNGGMTTGAYPAEGDENDPDTFIDALLGCWDFDGDGFLEASCGGDDCDDLDASVNPGMQGQDCLETPDGVDNDCDGQIDEDTCGGCFILTVF